MEAAAIAAPQMIEMINHFRFTYVPSASKVF